MVASLGPSGCLEESLPYGPVYIANSQSMSAWCTLAEECIRRSDDPLIAVDLEGDLRATCKLELVQLCVEPSAGMPACIAVLDYQLFPDCLSETSPVRAWLQSSSITRTFHNATNDCTCLYWICGITVRCLFDTVVGDSLARGVKHKTARGLEVVVYEYTGSTVVKDV